MQYAAVVPDEQIADLPVVLIAVLGLSCPRNQIVEKRACVFVTPTFDRARVGAHIVILLARRAIRTHELLRYRRQGCREGR